MNSTVSWLHPVAGSWARWVLGVTIAIGVAWFGVTSRVAVLEARLIRLEHQVDRMENKIDRLLYRSLTPLEPLRYHQE